MDTELDWGKLSFGYIPTDYNVRCYYRDGKWGDVEISQSETIDLHIAATSLHYGQEIFEGLKAFRGKDGKIRIFRLEENAKRIISSAKGLLMAPVPEELFCEMVKKVVKLNERFVPPYGSGASLYIRPLEIGISAQVGVKPATEYLFLILVTPVGPYFKEGFKPTNICIMREFDRVAPKGTGRWKVGGNYAASLEAGEKAHEHGYSAVLYLDPREKKYLDECGPANFFAIKDGKYITPASDSILPSITNKSLMQLARDMGIEVEQRHIPIEELESIQEAAACGTAAVASPVAEIDDLDTGKKYVVSKDGKPGPVVTALYNRLRAIQLGEEEDIHNWNTIVD
ncbi:MAG TPA: branched-chain amino acid aminotransferase [Muribaculum sp.]|jgi:branched-chain amino acid aminotransferase|uniref:branched-chain-amino-acid transaminase n=1 Tax=Heminiphilus faecis TaxID=2601703 RepID=A0ABV4CXY9_9BACT|nr:branched-chain amino acid aminotransferase [Heminiphilus faecis]RLT77866.1 branched-chain amino acid aminotransferase [bacterium J10(2018)]DAT44832.1 MAG TPA: branched-chain amino acid aminotransferase [Caudoviricetes sp.]HRF68052.1 branched-chain amino acid aminotransferase [Muribaculum sp.]